MHRWRTHRRNSIDRLIEVVGNKDISEITRSDGLAFRDWCRARIDRGEWGEAAATRMITNLSSIINRVDELRALNLGEPFKKLRFKIPKAQRLPFSTEFLRTEWLAPGAFAP